MNPEQAVRQLQSPSVQAREDVLRHVLHAPMGTSLDGKVRERIRDLYRAGPPWPDGLVEALLRYPCEEFADAAHHFLAEGGRADQARALELLHLWISARCLRAHDLCPLLARLRESDDPWIAFLASMQSARFCDNAQEAWQMAAGAIVNADRMEWWKSIRSAAYELLTGEERERLNEHLRSLAPEANR